MSAKPNLIHETESATTRVVTGLEAVLVGDLYG